MDENQTTVETLTSGISRRRFFGYAGALAGAGLLTGMAACKKNEDNRINLGNGELGLLNYLYAFKQLTAAFYTEISKAPYVGISSAEVTYLQDIRDHELAHRDFLRTFLGSNAIQELTANFSTIDFHDRTSVLSTARTFEDLSVSAYNGAGKLFSIADHLGLISKIVSVEARHAAIIRELLEPVTFADTSIVNPTTRIDLARNPAEVTSIIGPYFYEGLNPDNLPTA